MEMLIFELEKIRVCRFYIQVFKMNSINFVITGRYAHITHFHMGQFLSIYRFLSYNIETLSKISLSSQLILSPCFQEQLHFSYSHIRHQRFAYLFQILFRIHISISIRYSHRGFRIYFFFIPSFRRYRHFIILNHRFVGVIKSKSHLCSIIGQYRECTINSFRLHHIIMLIQIINANTYLFSYRPCLKQHHIICIIHTTTAGSFIADNFYRRFYESGI